MTGTIIRGIGSFYTVLCEEDGSEYTLRAQKKIRHLRMTPLVGDRVHFTPGTGEENGWLEEILPRRSELIRPSVANVDMLMLVMAGIPAPDLLLLDKLILAARQGGMIPSICINKIDLDGSLAEQLRGEYADTALKVYAVSAKTGEGIDDLRKTLTGKLVCLAGQSAVGKSSLINALMDLELETGGLSRKTERGRHTTRKAELLTGKGLLLMDTPGFSLLEIETLMEPQEFAEMYPEYNLRMGDCRFQPCTHDREPGCAVRKAVENGELNRERWERYRQLLGEVREKWKGRFE